MSPDEPSFRRIGTRTLADAGFLHVVREHVRAPDGQALARTVVHHPGAVAVVPVIDGDVVLIRQHRVPVGGGLLEIPAGKRDVAGEPPEVTAVRECEEEVGYRPGRLELLYRFFTAPGFCDEEMHLFRADQLEPVGVRPAGAEERAAEIVRLPLSEALARARSGEIRDAKTILGLLAVVP